MKKIITTVLLAALLLSLFSMAAIAAEAPTEGGIYGITVASAFSATAAVEALDEAGAAVTKTSAEIDGAAADFYPNSVQLKVTLSGVKAGNYYLILAQNDDSDTPVEDNIVYIDQITAEGTSVSFKVYPGKLDAGTTYYVYCSSNEDERALVLSFQYYVAYTLGDVNEDGSIGTVDALWTLQAYAGNRTLTANQQLAADANKDSSIGTVDALWILQAYAGNRTLN